MKEKNIKEFRHKLEMPLLIFGTVLTILVSIICIYVILSGGELKDWAMGILAGLVSPILAIIYLKYLYYENISNGVELGENQFPELYRVYKELAINMGFSKDKNSKNTIPKIYLKNGNGVMNAFATKCSLNGKYVVLYSDIVDIAYNKNDFNTLKFVMAHELGHIKCHHVDLKRLMIQPILTILFLGKSLSRAQEYTADRVALYYASEGRDGMIYLFAGKNLGNRVNLDEYFKNIEKYEKSFMLKVVNFRADHAIGYRRMQAIYDSREKGWNVHGKML